MEKEITLREFLLHHTRYYEFCVIRYGGYVIFTVWIDNEDLFKIPQGYADRKVLKDYWGELPIVYANGNRNYVDCHYIEI